MKISTLLKRVIPSVVFCLILFTTYKSYTHSSGSQASCTNAPGESTCAQSGCHTDNSGGQKNLFTKSASVTLDNGKGTATYVPGTTYTMTLTCNRTGHKTFGFQVTALASSTNKTAGKLAVTSSTTTQSITGFVAGSSRTYIEQTSSGTSGSGGKISWSFSWTAPKPAAGNVIFYATCNASNANGSSNGDTILAQTFTFSPDTSYPTAKFSFLPSNPCAGDTVHFSDSSTNKPTSWSWVFQNGTPATSSSQNSTVVFGSGGTDSVTLNSSNSTGTSKTVKQFIKVNPRAGDTIQVKGSTSICSGSSVSLVAPFGVSYKWSTGDTTQTISVFNQGTYSVNVSNGSCITKSIPVGISVLPVPVVNLSKSEDTACAGDSVIFTATSGLSSYTFYKNGSKVQLGVSNTYKAGNIQPGDSFSAIGTNSSGCSSIMSAKTGVAQPVLPFAPLPACGTVTASSITFTWPQLFNCDGYEVSTDSGKNWTKLSPGNTDTTYSITGLSFDTYVDLYVRGYNHSKCTYGPVGQALCKTLSCANITYGLKYDSAICSGGMVSLHFSNISINHYSISINGSAPSADTFFQAVPDANGQIQISIKDSSSACAPQKAILPITVHKLISLKLKSDVADSTYCVGSKALLTATSGFSNYAFYRNKAIVQSGASPIYTTPALVVGDSYGVKATNTYGCGNATASIGLIVQAPSIPFFSYKANGLAFTFKDSSTGETSRTWYFGDGDTGINTLQTHTYTLPAKYKVTLKTFSPGGCSDTVSEFVIAKLKSGIAPNNFIQDVVIYPNPSHASFSLSFSSAQAGMAYLKVINMNWQETLSKEIRIEEGQNTAQVDLGNSPQGFYFMQLIRADGVNTFKLIKN